jgi:hypothetical protein
VKVADQTTLYNLGCAQGLSSTNNTNIVVVLDFGQPAFDGTNYGANLLTKFSPPYDFVTVGTVLFVSEGFVYGFYNCSPSNAHLTLALGLNNTGGNQVNYNHGVAWAQLVNSLNNWITSPPSYGTKVTAKGGMDIEAAYNTAANTLSWVDGYSSAYTAGTSYYYDFGSCDSCPYTQCPTCQPLNHWTLEDIWSVAYGKPPAQPLPDIYNSAHADQWYRMSLYGYNNHGYPMTFLGAMTEYVACQQRDNCAGIDNIPSAGYLQLYSALNADPHTAQPLSWSTDICWQGEPIVYPNP